MESERVTSISLCSLFKFLNTGFCLGFPQWWTVNYKTKTNKQTKEPFLLNWKKEQVNVRLRRRWSIYFNPCRPVRFREYFLLSSSHLSLYMCICVCVCAYVCVCVCMFCIYLCPVCMCLHRYRDQRKMSGVALSLSYSFEMRYLTEQKLASG